MLDFMRQTLPNLCWLRDSEHQVALEPAEWSAAPRPNVLNFYAPSFDVESSKTPWLVGEDISWPDSSFNSTLSSPTTHRPPDEDAFFKIHSEICEKLIGGEFKKVVPYISDVYAFSENLSWRNWPRARDLWTDQWAYGFHMNDEGMVGVTPEILFHVRGQTLTTMALAGTGRLGGPSLLEDKKEKLEHDLVIEHIVQSLRGLGAITVGQTQELNYPKLKHLKTPIHLQLENPPVFGDLIHRLHPTAALGGWPRAEALNFLREKGEPRGRFGAPFGFIRGEQMLAVVAIRSLQWQKNRAQVFSGAGVVSGSVAEREWRELQLKRRATLEQLGAPWL